MLMGPTFIMPPPLLPQLDLPYFTIIHIWKESGDSSLYITAVHRELSEDDSEVNLEPQPYSFERVSYINLI